MGLVVVAVSTSVFVTVVSPMYAVSVAGVGVCVSGSCDVMGCVSGICDVTVMGW
jgi:hypothetical protein